MRPTSSLRPSALPNMGKFINITKLPLSAEYIYIYIYSAENFDNRFLVGIEFKFLKLR